MSGRIFSLLATFATVLSLVVIIGCKGGTRDTGDETGMGQETPGQMERETPGDMSQRVPGQMEGHMSMESETVTVEVAEESFEPEQVTVSVGDTVIWENEKPEPLTIKSGTPESPSGEWESVEIKPGDSYKHVFSQPGTYHYFTGQPGAEGMTGTVVVREKSASGQPEGGGMY